MKNYPGEPVHVEHLGLPLIKGTDGIWYRFFDDCDLYGNKVEKDKNGNTDNDVIHFKNNKKARRKDLKKFSIDNNVYINNDVYLNREKIMVKRWISIFGINVIILYKGNEKAIGDNIIERVDNLCLTEGK